MVRALGARDAMQDGTVAQGGNGQTTRLLSASEQLSTRSCARCAGLLVNEWFYGLDNAGEHNVEILRCVQCGYRIDPVILLNQCRPADESRRVRRGPHRHSLRTVTLP